jgi:hypothetical protein
MSGRATALAIVGVILLSACAPIGGGRSGLTSTMRAASSVFGEKLAFGLRNDPSDLEWMSASGVPWAARYTYLSGGVNSEEGWATWSAEPGAYATEYARRSIAAGYLPIFSYYQLQQSKPGRGGSEAQRAHANLIDPVIMRAYYQDFRLLMRALDHLGTVVVHVEPDLWGYLEQARSAATSVAASVRSSGDPDVSGEPDNATGFAQALMDLRDRYAPNVLLAVHASAWGAGPDPIVSTATLDAARLAKATAQFIRSTERADRRWDLVFHDVIDRDAAFAEGNVAGRAWWDAKDETLPNFSRWLTFVSALSSGLGRPIVVWQVPVGNQRFRSMDNSPGHFQDNRAEYFLAHPDLLAAAGVAAVLFGPGVADATWYLDARHDGITNPPPVTTFGCDRCNIEVATFADDDGGNLRLSVGAYYRAGGVALAGR